MIRYFVLAAAPALLSGCNPDYRTEKCATTIARNSAIQQCITDTSCGVSADDYFVLEMNRRWIEDKCK